MTTVEEAVEAARKGIAEAEERLQGRLRAALERFGPGCDADAVAAEATRIRAEAGEGAEAIEVFREFLEERVSGLRSMDETAERLTDDAYARYYGP